MTTNVNYGTQGIIKVLNVVEVLKNGGELVIQHLIYFVEDKLEEVVPGGSIKLFCCRSTFDKYLRNVRVHAPEGNALELKPFRGIMRAIPSEAFSAIVEYCNMVRPNCVILAKPDINNSD